MKKILLTIMLLLIAVPTALAFTPYSNQTYGGKYSDYIPTFVTSRNIKNDQSLSEGFNSTDRNFRIQLPYFVTDPFTNEKIADNNTLFAVSILYDDTVNSLAPCQYNHSDTLNDQVWIIDRQGSNWIFDLNSTTNWQNDKAKIFYFEATNYDAEIDSYNEIIDVRLTYETFCPTIKLWAFRKLSWTEVEIANQENRATDIHTIAQNIFNYAISIVELNYSLWLIAYWIALILILIGVVALVFAIPFFIYKQVKGL